MSITINYTARHGIANLMLKAREFGKKNSVAVEGDDRSGTIRKSGWTPVKGTYSIKGDSITIEVTQIPIIATWGVARSEILKWLNQNDTL